MKNILSSLSQSEKNRILEMHKSATRKNYLNESTTPNLGIAQGDVVTFKNVTIPQGSGEFRVSIRTNPEKGQQSDLENPSCKVMDVKYYPANKEVTGSVNKVVLSMDYTAFTFKLEIRGGSTPVITASNFIESGDRYFFVVDDNLGAIDTEEQEVYKDVFGRKYTDTAKNLRKSIFGSQSWVTNIQKAIS